VLEIRAAFARAADARRPRRGHGDAEDGDLGADLEGTEEARLDLCRPHHRLRLHAGDGHGQRPPRRLRLPGGGGARSQEVQAAEVVYPFSYRPLCPLPRSQIRAAPSIVSVKPTNVLLSIEYCAAGAL